MHGWAIGLTDSQMLPINFSGHRRAAGRESGTHTIQPPSAQTHIFCWLMVAATLCVPCVGDEMRATYVLRALEPINTYTWSTVTAELFSSFLFSSLLFSTGGQMKRRTGDSGNHVCIHMSVNLCVCARGYVIYVVF